MNNNKTLSFLSVLKGLEIASDPARVSLSDRQASNQEYLVPFDEELWVEPCPLEHVELAVSNTLPVYY